jgi:flagellar biosynthesis chaperone FliJ
MPRVHFVKKALKDNSVCKKGESYYWWKHRRKGARSGFKRMSKNRPRPSQLTMSEYLSAVYSLQEDIEDAKPESLEDLQSMLEEWKSQVEEIRDNCQEKFDNMPEGLQQGEIGQLLEQRVQAMEEWINDLDNVQIDPDDKNEDTLENALDEIRNIGVDVF